MQINIHGIAGFEDTLSEVGRVRFHPASPSLMLLLLLELYFCKTTKPLS